MATDLDSWERPHYERTDAQAFLFYVAFGDIAVDRAMSRSRYRSEGVPDGVEVRLFNVEEDEDYIAGFRSGYLWDRLLEDAPTLAHAVETAPGCALVLGTLDDPPTLDYLRDCVGLLTHFTDNGACAIYDPQMFQWWAPEDWREQIFDPAGPVPRQHTTILVSDDDIPGRMWIHTRGLRKFARPDISVRHIGPAWVDRIVEMCNRFIEHQAFGMVIPEAEEIAMEGLPPSGRAYHGGHLDDPQFNNLHVEIRWPVGALYGEPE